MAKTKEIQQRIKSVKNTKKITKAMEMVAAAKMRKSVEAVLRTRSYANLSWMTVLNLSNSTNNLYEKHPLLTYKKDIKKVCVVLITANRGLCGSLNTAIVNKAIQSIEGEVQTDFILLGKRGSSVHKRGHNIIAEFDKNDALTEVLEVRPLAKMIVDDYLAHKYDKVMVAYTDFVNAVTQEPRIKQIIPVDVNKEDGCLGVVGEDTRLKTDKEYIHGKEEKYLEVKDKYAAGKFDYVFEPGPEEVLNEMVPRLVEVQLFQALLESNASEHSARMNAMRNATSAASDIIDELTLFYNKARQASITSEIAEISAGANALK
jgi:F-type H+-transporting ATPase subunit gamma